MAEKQNPRKNERDLFEALYRANSNDLPWEHEDPDPDLIDFTEKLNVPPNSRVLDAGCGNGKNLIYLKKKGFEVHGFDISKTAVALAKERVPLSHLIIADARNLPYGDVCFDFIVDIGLLHCVPPNGWESFKNEVFRVLKPRGYYYLREFHRQAIHPPDRPLFYENVDQTGRTYNERDQSRDQIPMWGFTLPQIRAIFREFKIETELSIGNRILVLMSKGEKQPENKEVKEPQGKVWSRRIAEGLRFRPRPSVQNK